MNPITGRFIHRRFGTWLGTMLLLTAAALLLLATADQKTFAQPGRQGGKPTQTSADKEAWQLTL
jgi:hypothetical protein